MIGFLKCSVLDQFNEAICRGPNSFAQRPLKIHGRNYNNEVFSVSHPKLSIFFIVYYLLVCLCVNLYIIFYHRLFLATEVTDID